MILVDVNLLVYATVGSVEQHERAREWLAVRLGGPVRVGLPWASLLGFVRVVTNARIWPRPLAMPRAWSQVTEWLALPQVWTPGPTHRHVDVLGGLMADVAISEHVTDAHLAALALEHGLIVCSNDRGFARFRGLRWENPLETT